ncbi:hypothetical protein BDV93DRAFT_561112 [Ceratobasidium sp. AG-I]|nr:hypothetical protein BDV93DRAFT_561112 [Ceratobasidium sp. AG-I]
MATPKILLDARDMCLEAKIDVNPQLLLIKIEDSAEAEGKPDEPRSQIKPQARRKKDSKPKSRYRMTLGMAKLLATSGCRVSVLDREFNNPDHELCYNVGACNNCVRERETNEAVDRHASSRQVKREAVELSIAFYDGEAEELKHEAAKSANEGKRQGNEWKIFKSAIQSWQKKKIMELLDVMDLCEDTFMTDPELLRIAKSRSLTDISSFDHADVHWPGQTEWQLELLALIQDLERSEQEKAECFEHEAEEKRGLAEEKRGLAEEKRRLAEEKRRLAEEVKQQKQLERNARTQARPRNQKGKAPEDQLKQEEQK